MTMHLIEVQYSDDGPWEPVAKFTDAGAASAYAARHSLDCGELRVTATEDHQSLRYIIVDGGVSFSYYVEALAYEEMSKPPPADDDDGCSDTP